jgi:signal transduction histidine kinase
MSAPDIPSDSLDTLRHDLAIQRARFDAFREISAAVSSVLNLDQLLRLIMAKSTELMNADRSTMYLLDSDRNELWSKVLQGNDIREIRVAIGEGIAGWVAQTGESLNIADAYEDPRFNSDFDERTGFRTKTVLCQPMRNQRGDIIGVIQVLNKAEGAFDDEDEQVLTAITNQAAISVENSKLYLSVVGKNIALRDTQIKLQQRLDEIDLLYRVEQAAGQESELDLIVDTLLRQACETIPSHAAVLLLRENKQWSPYVYPQNEGPDNDPSTDYTTECSVAVRVAESGDSHRSNTMDNPDRRDRLAEQVEVTLESTLCVPIKSGDDILGALQLLNRRHQVGYTTNDLKLLTVLAGQVTSLVRRVQARVEELNANRLAAIGQALSGVVHDLRTPVTIISGNAQLMVDEEDPTERQASAETIAQQVNVIRSMTNEVLSFARGQSNLLLQKVQLHPMIESVEEGLRQEFDGRNIELRVDQEYRGPARIDEGKIRRAIFNVARNAHQAMPNGGKFHIRIQHDTETNQVVFELADTGLGIPDDIRHTVFESFVSSGKRSGTGIGLAIVKKIVEEHEGSVDFDSDPAGTTFRLRIPRGIDS